MIVQSRPVGKIIFVNGASSAGKSTLTLAAQQVLPVPFLRYSFDIFLDFHALPMEHIRSGRFDWSEIRPAVFDGIHASIQAMAAAGNNLIIDTIIENKEMLTDLLTLLYGFDVYFVALHCSVEELERRERQRGDRPVGEARRDLDFVHKYTRYDLELDCSATPEENAVMLSDAWQARTAPSAFDLLRQLSTNNGTS